MDDKPLNALQAGKALNVSTGTVIRLFNEGAFPNAYRLGSKYFIPPADLESAKQRPFKPTEQTA